MAERGRVRKAESQPGGGELGLEFNPCLPAELAFVRRFIEVVASLPAQV